MPGYQARNVVASLADPASDLDTWDEGWRDQPTEPVAAEQDVHQPDRSRLDVDRDLAASWLRDLDVGYLQYLRPTELLDNHRPHRGQPCVVRSRSTSRSTRKPLRARGIPA